MIKPMDMENIIMIMVEYIQDIGLMISNMGQVQNYGGIHLNIMEIIIMVKKKEQEHFYGLIMHYIKGNGRKTLQKDMVFIFFQMEGNTLEVLKIIK